MVPFHCFAAEISCSTRCTKLHVRAVVERARAVRGARCKIWRSMAVRREIAELNLGISPTPRPSRSFDFGPDALQPALAPRSSLAPAGFHQPNGMPPQYRRSSTASPRSASEHSSPSQIYSESLPDNPSFLSEDPSGLPDESASLQHQDSLLDASPEQVEARALELLALDSNKSSTLIQPQLSALDLPRPLPPASAPPEVQQAAQQAAVAFLRTQLQQADDTEWQFSTPAVFGPPRVLDPRAQSSNDDDDEGTAGCARWMDSAFNLESYGHPDLVEEEELPVEMEGAGQFGDLAPAQGFGGAYGMTFVREEEGDPAGIGGRGVYD